MNERSAREMRRVRMTVPSFVGDWTNAIRDWIKCKTDFAESHYAGDASRSRRTGARPLKSSKSQIGCNGCKMSLLSEWAANAFREFKTEMLELTGHGGL